MNGLRAPDSDSRLWNVTVACAMLLAAAGAVLLVHALGASFPGGAFPGLARVDAGAALCLVLIGGSLACLGPLRSGPRMRSLGLAAAAAAACIAGFKLVRLLTGVRAPSDAMSATTTSCLVLLSVALLALDWKTTSGRRPAMAAALAAGAGGLVEFTASLYDVRHPEFSAFAPASMYAPLLVLVGTAGVLCSRPDGGPLVLLGATGSGSTLARRLLPLVIAVPPLLGWIRLLGQRAGFFGLEDGLALFAVSNVAIFAALTWITAAWLNRSEASRLQERRFSDTALDSLPGIFYLYDREFRFLRWNRNFEHVSGYSAAEIARMGPLDFFRSPDRERVAERIDEVFEKGDSSVEAEFVSRDGRRTPYFFTGIATTIDGTHCLLGTGVDISERKRAEEGLARFRSAMDTALDGIFVMDFETFRYLDVNATGCRMLGYSREELLGMSPLDTNPGLSAELQRRKFDEARALGPDRVMTERDERYMRHRDGRMFPVEIARRYLRAGGREIVVGVARDITKTREAEDRLRASEAQYRNLIEQASDGIYVIDGGGRFVLANSRCCEMLDYDVGELLGAHFSITYVDPEHRQAEERMRQTQAGATLRFERMVRRKDGSAFPAEFSSRLLGNGLVQVIFRDITERRLQETKIARLSRIQAVLSGINSAIVRIHEREPLLAEACRIAAKHGDFRLAWIGRIDTAGRIVPESWSGDAAEHIAGLVQRTAPPLSDQGVAARAASGGRTVIDNDITAAPDIDALRRRTVDLGCRSVIALPLFSEQKVAGVLVLYGSEKDAFDEDEVRLLEELAGDVSFALTFIAQRERVDYLAYYDALTGLPNRSLLFDRLGRQVASADRDRDNVLLALVDINRFRMVNETLGRQSGDALIRAVADRLKDAVRAEDTVARMGADRFAVAVSGHWTIRELTRLIETRSRALFGRPFPIGGEELLVAASVGAAVWPTDADGPEALVANAEAALRDAKRQNVPLLFYSPGMNASVAESLRMETRLRRAIEQGELELWYQPKTDVTASVVFGLEALMRWRSPDLGLVPPAKFIPIMEQSGIILEAGNWALNQVSRDSSHWSAAGIRPPRVAVNVSPIQLRQSDFVARVIEAHGQTEAAGGRLDIELTESTVMEDIEKIIPQLQTINGLGVEIYVDDFGTGYSSLAYIARLPIQALKIDRSFVIGMMSGGHNLNIVKSVISLAHSLKLRVVAEGVETGDQAGLLAELGCDQLQGYLVSKPLPASQIPDLLRRFPGQVR